MQALVRNPHISQQINAESAGSAEAGEDVFSAFSSLASYDNSS
jgi:hypothetical protein